MRTIEWDPTRRALRMIDQRLLPGDLVMLELRTCEQVCEAIREMAVRGAPAIGASAAFGLALAALNSEGKAGPAFLETLQEKALQLRKTRPTAVNLGWALDRMSRVLDAHEALGPADLAQLLVEEAQRIADEDVAVNRRIAKNGAALLQDGDTVIHHCNTGALATVDYGTALGVIRRAHETGKHIHVLVDETRPRLQGARLTAWELQQLGIPYEIITDNAAGYFLQRGLAQAAIVGADRVAANGDIANKIGTYMLALAAADNQVPFYCAAPLSTLDLSVPSGEAIPIEERAPEEVLDLERGGRRLSPPDSGARNPAFDITPHHLLTAIITEAGVVRAPYEASLQRALQESKP